MSGAMINFANQTQGPRRCVVSELYLIQEPPYLGQFISECKL
jgi:hypothetical protein